MYIIYVDDVLAYAPNVESLYHTCYSIQMELKVNEAGSLTFTITNENPVYQDITRKKSYVRVLSGTAKVFCGRATSIERDWNNNKVITCEGDLAILGDYYLRATSSSPISYKGSLANYFMYLLNTYNARAMQGAGEYHQAEKLFSMGIATVIGDDDDDGKEDNGKHTLTETVTMLDALKGLVDQYGGYLVVTYKGDNKCLNYVQKYEDITTDFSDIDYTKTCNQSITFGSNLLSLDEVMDSDDLFTVVIPTGENGLVLSDPDYVYDDDAVDTYGIIEHTESFSGITSKAALQKAAKAYLTKSLQEMNTITMTAVDLSMVDSTNDSFMLGTTVKVLSVPHSLQAEYMVTAVTIPLESPGDASYTFGEPIKSLTEQMAYPASVKVVKNKAEAASEAAQKASTTLATTANPGLMSTVDKSKLDSLPELTTAQKQKLLELLQ